MAKGIGANWGTLVPRFLLAVVFLHHGGRILFGLFGADPGTLRGIEDRILAWGWPLPGVLARAVGVTEFFGGACLALGLLVRFWSAALCAVMVVGAWKVHGPNGFGYAGGGWEYNFVLGILALSLVVQGGGAFSLDASFFKGRRKAEKPPA